MFFTPETRSVIESVLANAPSTSSLSAVSRTYALNTAISQVGSHNPNIPAEVSSAAKAVIQRAIILLTQESNISVSRELNSAQLAEMVNARKLQYEPPPPRIPPVSLSPESPEILNSADAISMYSSRIAERDIIEFEVLSPPADTGKHVSWRNVAADDDISELRTEIAEMRAALEKYQAQCSSEIAELKDIISTRV